jgi:ATP-dependent RNA helicase DDX47/RRP3
LYQRIEQLIGKKLPLYPTVEEEVLCLMERVSEAQRMARMELESSGSGRGRKKGRSLMPEDDSEEMELLPSKKKHKKTK